MRVIQTLRGAKSDHLSCNSLSFEQNPLKLGFTAHASQANTVLSPVSYSP